MRSSRTRADLQRVALALLTCSLVAAAAPYPIAAQSVGFAAATQATARRQGEFAAGGITWLCNGTRCTTTTMPSATAVPLTMCQALAREAGPLGSFGTANLPMNAKDLQQCNNVLPSLPAGVKLTMPSPAAKPAGAAASPSYPLRIRTADLTVTGTGMLATVAPFALKRIRTADLTVTGTGMLATFAPFTPKSIRTEVLTVTGTGVIR